MKFDAQMEFMAVAKQAPSPTFKQAV